ncbi:MAG: DUF5056 domain-containing protein [Paludibacter sp.]
MENKDMISAFFSENKQPISDNGFSNRVITHLPETGDKQWIVLLMAALGASITILLGYYSGLFNLICSYLHQVSPFVLLGAFVSFPLISLFVVLNQRRVFA